MAFDKQLIEAFERGISKEDMQTLCVECGYSDAWAYGVPPFMGGFSQLEVVEVPSGAIFRIDEYDGSESIEIFDKDDWYVAEGEYYDCNS